MLEDGEVTIALRRSRVEACDYLGPYMYERGVCPGRQIAHIVGHAAESIADLRECRLQEESIQPQWHRENQIDARAVNVEDYTII